MTEGKQIREIREENGGKKEKNGGRRGGRRGRGEGNVVTDKEDKEGRGRD